MSFRLFLSKQIRNSLRQHSYRGSVSCIGGYRSADFISSRSLINAPRSTLTRANYSKFDLNLRRYTHSIQADNLNESSTDSENAAENEAITNEFLSRFVWLMRQKVNEAYPDYDKETVDAMLLIIVERVMSEIKKGGYEKMVGINASIPSDDFSEDLWRTVWEVSNTVLQDMKKEEKKEKMKGFLQSEEVKEMYRFAGKIGIRGDMLRELRFKWAREKMEESEFYESLENLQKEEMQAEYQEETKLEKTDGEKIGGYDNDVAEDKQETVSLPKRHGKMKYKIYGLDLSDPKWAAVADKIHESSETFWPPEPKEASGKCKLVAEKILFLRETDDPIPLLEEWKSLLQPSRIDWIALLDKLKQQDSHLYLKIAEIVLDEDSFVTSVHDYSKLVDAHARENRFEDAERILKKMNEKGIQPDVLTSAIMVHMYSKWGNLDRAKEAYDSFRIHGFRPDTNVYRSMIMAYVNANDPQSGNFILSEMEARNIKPSKDIYMALLQSYAQIGKVDDVRRISTAMQFAGVEPNLESCTLLVEAFGRVGNLVQARSSFDQMMKLGIKPDDRCTASMISVYEKKNLLDKALNLLLDLEKDGFEPGIATLTVMIDWLSKMLLIDEAEQMLDNIVDLGESPSVKVHVSLCDMYSRAGMEKKALQTLGVLESKKDQLGPHEFERIINSLLVGKFFQDARRMTDLMKAMGFVPSQNLEMNLTAKEAFSRKRNNQTGQYGASFPRF